MSRVEIVTGPDRALLDGNFNFTGHRCHAAPAFLEASRPNTGLVWFGERRGDDLIASAIAYAIKGRLAGRLVFPTPPALKPEADETRFWESVHQYCRKNRVARIAVHSFEATECHVPPLGPWRMKERTEYEISLAAAPDELFSALSKNHRRNVKKSEKERLEVRVETSPAAADEHTALFAHSMGRRAARGESVPASDSGRVRRLLAAGAGRLFRVEREGRPLSSLCILSTAERAYYHSGGSAPEGMKLGASHRAMWEAILQCRTDGIRTFSLGGVSETDSPGLGDYKLGFGARAISVAHCDREVDLAFPWNLVRRLLQR